MTKKKTIINKKRLLFSSLLASQLELEPLTIVDAGARGDLEEPWKSAPEKMLRIIGFEPDQEECRRLNSEHPNRTYIPAALWSEKRDLKINVTSFPFCSSVYSPNMQEITKYDKRHWEQRTVSQVIAYPSTTIDIESKSRGFKADFVKIDTQGSELEILKGASESLTRDIFAVLAETWTTEVYKGQPLAWQIMDFMHRKGFALFDLHVAASWKRKGGYELKSGKGQVIGLDMLFFRDDNIEGAKTGQNRFFASPAKLLKAAAISEVYGFPDFALSLIAKYGSLFKDDTQCLTKAMSSIKEEGKKDSRSFLRRMNRKLYSLANVTHRDYPSLHS